MDKFEKISQQERKELLELYSSLRVADVRDGMDTVMLHHVGSMSPSIRPLFRTRTCGIAKTARYLPYSGTIPALSPEKYWEWCRWYYQNVSTSWMKDVEEGDFGVIDQCGVDSGIMGSNNSLGGVRKGIRGYVTNGGVRDTDEIILQKIPFWSSFISQKMVQGRVQFDATDIPVSVGGVLVNPGDVVVADGDGVIVVPRNLAPEVAKHAKVQLKQDKAGRRKLYIALGMDLDDSVSE